MEIDKILNGENVSASIEEQEVFFNQMKNQKVFDLDDNKIANLINFICESDIELAIDYLYHVLDEEISYPIDDDKVKRLFTDDRMVELKNTMLERLNSETSDEDEESDEDEDD